MHIQRVPNPGEKVWFIPYKESPKKGVIQNVYQHSSEMSSVSADIKTATNDRYLVNIDQIFDHKPEYIRQVDSMGAYYTWY